MNAAFEEAHHRRQLDHATWQVSFIEFLLKTHRSLTVKDEAWKREEAQLVERLSKAKEHLQGLSTK